MRGRHQYHTVIQIGETLERCLEEVPAVADLHFLLHRKNFQNERVDVAAIDRLRRKLNISREQDFAGGDVGNDGISFVRMPKVQEFDKQVSNSYPSS